MPAIAALPMFPRSRKASISIETHGVSSAGNNGKGVPTHRGQRGAASSVDQACDARESRRSHRTREDRATQSAPGRQHALG